MAKIKVTLKSGVQIEGESAEVRSVLQVMGELPEEDGIHYISESKGPVVIGEMNTFHIQNAICKSYRAWTADLNKKPIEEFLRLLHRGPHGITMEAMVKELIDRKERGMI